MWEHYDDLPFEVFCVDSQGVRHLLRRHHLESEAVQSVNVQNRSGGYAAEYQDWRKVELEKGSSNIPAHVDMVLVVAPTPDEERVSTVIKMREVKCMLCNDCGTAQGCLGCQKVDPYLKAYAGSLVNDETGDPYS
jgi:hypothetical protein